MWQTHKVSFGCPLCVSELFWQMLRIAIMQSMHLDLPDEEWWYIFMVAKHGQIVVAENLSSWSEATHSLTTMCVGVNAHTKQPILHPRECPKYHFIWQKKKCHHLDILIILLILLSFCSPCLRKPTLWIDHPSWGNLLMSHDMNIWKKEIEPFDFMVVIMKTIFKSISSR